MEEHDVGDLTAHRRSAVVRFHHHDVGAVGSMHLR